MSGGEILISAAGLAAGYGGRAVVSGVTLEIRAGACWCLLGPNGAGKSTLVAALLGLIPALAGTVRRHAAVADRARVGFVPQRCDLVPTVPTTVREFVGLGLVGAGVPGRERAGRLAAVIAEVGLGGLERRPYWSLSGGQRQRALIARALVRRPALLVVDEPTNGLDVAAQAALAEVLAQAHGQDGLAVVVVTHDLALAARLATHVAFVHRGAVIAGERAAVLTPRLLEEVFGIAAGAGHG